jgi:hypothetical protein
MRNLCKHAESCWGAASVKAVTDIGNINDAHTSVQSLKATGTLEAAFKKKDEGRLNMKEY